MLTEIFVPPTPNSTNPILIVSSEYEDEKKRWIIIKDFLNHMFGKETYHSLVINEKPEDGTVKLSNRRIYEYVFEYDYLDGSNKHVNGIIESDKDGNIYLFKRYKEPIKSDNAVVITDKPVEYFPLNGNSFMEAPPEPVELNPNTFNVDDTTIEITEEIGSVDNTNGSFVIDTKNKAAKDAFMKNINDKFAKSK